MAIYYFDFQDGDRIIVDDEGVNLTDLEVVEEEAARSLAGLAWAATRDLKGAAAAARMTINVRDDLGPVMQVGFACRVLRKQ